MDGWTQPEMIVVTTEAVLSVKLASFSALTIKALFRKVCPACAASMTLT